MFSAFGTEGAGCRTKEQIWCGVSISEKSKGSKSRFCHYVVRSSSFVPSKHRFKVGVYAMREISFAEKRVAMSFFGAAEPRESTEGL